MQIQNALICFDLSAWLLLAAGYAFARRLGLRGISWELRLFLGLGVVLALASIALGSGCYANNFATLRFMIHALACVLLPLLAWRGLRIWQAGARWLGPALVLCALSGESVYIYARQVEPYWLEVSHQIYTSRRLPPGTPAIRLVVLADLQTEEIGAYERQVFARLDALRADLILLPGDFLQFRDHHDAAHQLRTRRALEALFDGLQHQPRYGIYAVDGDVDSVRGSLRHTKVQGLRDELVTLPGTPPLQLWGLSPRMSRMPRIPLRGAKRRAVHDFAGLTIIMGHAPDFALPDLRLVEAQGPEACRLPALCVAGHTHGGQVVLPFLGPPITLSAMPRRYLSGLHRFGEMGLLVSRGVGHERGYAPRLRFNCRPELAVIELRPVETSSGGR